MEDAVTNYRTGTARTQLIDAGRLRRDSRMADLMEAVTHTDTRGPVFAQLCRVSEYFIPPPDLDPMLGLIDSSESIAVRETLEDFFDG